eukprot:scaffold85834_cov44-Cyclotella_meneghiniana.AAC.2
MTLKEGHLSPGDCISCDHYISPVPGRVIFIVRLLVGTQLVPSMWIILVAGFLPSTAKVN